MKSPLSVYFDRSASEALRLLLTEDVSRFMESDLCAADVVIFGTDNVHYVRRSELYQAQKAKSICISESDVPTFRLPGLYAANERSLIASHRTKTTSYLIYQRIKPNPEVERLVGQQVEKRYLYSFIGGSNSWARKRLFRYIQSKDDVLVEATRSFDPIAFAKDEVAATKAQHTARYARVLAGSKFSLCPRGCGLSSHRLFETMALGIAPVIISDRWHPVDGIDWSFALFVRERDIPNLDKIIRSYEDEWEQRGKLARAAFDAQFSHGAIAELVHTQITELLAQYDPRREMVIAGVISLREANRRVYWELRRRLRRIILKGFALTGVPLPITLHQPLELQMGRRKSL
jgi:hypothetical protein